MEHHAEEVFRLIPCWLASPETISAVFPLMPGFFDLVIFDEASQCYAEYGIPAIYRGRQTVVVGDSKQLTPFDLYRIKYEADTEEETPALEVASLLDLAKQYWPEVQLQGHYRSQSLALIDFSNQHFYKNKLQLLPYFKVANSLEPAIYYEKVEGVWENNQNEVEADKIVELVQQLQQNFPMASLGIVTFNQPQQQLIAQKIALIEEQGTQIASALFVKNIENVQGDERDIILFSVGYAPDIRGKMKAQFGSLNVQGGENRLNVAITRARQRIVVVTSILPHQLQVEDTAHVGPKLLKAYLYYALEVSEGIFKPQPLILEKKYSDWFLKEQLKQKKTTQELKEELPFADLTIKENNRYTGVILTDDEHYQQAISVKEAHAYLPLQLRNKGWFFERVWSREWWRKQ
ncbi:MAG: AAA domain-containing protein [Spirosomataceae bacterium]